MLNPYAPPSAAPAAPAAPVPPRRAAVVVLAWTEIVAGLALGSRGCVLCLALPDSELGTKILGYRTDIAHLAALMVLWGVFVGLVFPGVVLLKVRHPARWLAQALPLALVVWLRVT